jgi:hypothetical protein
MKSHARLVAATAAALTLGLVMTATPAMAECNVDNALFEDNFEFLDVSWGEPDDTFLVEDDALVVKGWREQVNFTTQNDGANVCVDATIAEASAEGNSPMGLIFWWQDWDNYYYLWYWADGGLEVRRILKGKSTTVFTTETLALKKGVGETNHLELQLRPRDATIIINGTNVQRFKGIQPKDGGVVGVTATSPQDASATFKFDNFIVSLPDEE